MPFGIFGKSKKEKKKKLSYKSGKQTKELKDAVWSKGKKVKGKNPNLHRKDAKGNEIYKPAYGKRGEKSWEIDHKKPKSKGGSHDIGNLQPLQSKANRDKGNKESKGLLSLLGL